MERAAVRCARAREKVWFFLSSASLLTPHPLSAAALTYPVASRLGDALGIPPVVMSTAVMLGASDAFISPFGYQCNLMVYAAGGYRTSQFIKFGIPLQLVQFATVTLIFVEAKYRWALAGASAALLAFVAVWPLVWGLVSPAKKEALTASMRGRRTGKAPATRSFNGKGSAI